jgi:hypothetical protein
MLRAKISLHVKKLYLSRAIDIPFLAFVVLFFSETTYYLLVLQTGIVEYFNSNLAQIWMIPIGGILGISLVFTLKNRYNMVLLALVAQSILMFFYPHFDGLALFLLGLLSGLVAPFMIYQIKSLNQVFATLGLSYVSGTFGILIAPENRGFIAVILSITALVSFLFIKETKKKENTQTISNSMILKIFSWLVLDSILFETLSRSSVTIWKNENFVYIIAVSHIIGLALAFVSHKKRYDTVFIISMFLLSYLFFVFKLQYPLAIVYPIVISYYNVIILKKFMKLPFDWLILATFSLWISAGIGLFISLQI